MTGAFIYNGHFRGPLTITPVAECLAVELLQPVFNDLVLSRLRLNTQPSACEANALTNYATAALVCFVSEISIGNVSSVLTDSCLQTN